MTAAVAEGAKLELTPDQTKIAQAMIDMEPGAILRDIRARTGDTKVATRDMEALAHAGVVEKVPLNKVPFWGYTLSPAWRERLTTPAVPEPSARVTVTPEVKEQLLRRFFSGDAETPAKRCELAREFGLKPYHIHYHFGVWEKEGRPLPPGVVAVDPEPEPEPEPIPEDLGAHLEAAELAGVFDDQGEEPPTEQEQVQSEQAPQGEVIDQPVEPPEIDLHASKEPAPAVVQPDPAKADVAPEGMGPTTPAEAVEPPAPEPGPIAAGLQEVKPETAVSSIAPAHTAMAQALIKAGLVAKQSQEGTEELPEVGRVYEGVIVRIEHGYVLVSLMGITGPRGTKIIGKVSKYEASTRLPVSCLDLGWKANDWVNVKVLSVNEDPHQDKLYIQLSVKQAPPHPHGPKRTVMPLEPIVARGSEVAAQISGAPAKANGDSPEARAEVERLTKERDEAVAGARKMAADLAEAVKANAELAAKWGQLLEESHQGICATCLFRHAGFCEYLEVLPDTYTVPEKHLLPAHQSKKVVFGRTPIISCDLYRPEKPD